MSKYGERDATRTIALVADGDGLFDAPQSTDDDPMGTIVRRFGRAAIKGATLVDTSPTTLYTPASGDGVRLKWVYLATPSTAVDTVVTVKLGAAEHYIVPLSAPGVFMRTSIREGAADAAFTVEMDVATDVYVNYELEEYSP